jgi:serine/threonine-protein kinase
MSNVPPSDNGSLPLDIDGQVDRICDRFEEAWKQGQRPRIEDFLPNLDRPGRSTLLQHLVKLDIYYRRRAGENPIAEDYRHRFSEVDSLVAGLTVLESPTPPQAPTPSPVPTGVTPTGRYQLGQEIGRGGMGAVLKGRDPELDRDLAIKVLLEQHQDQPDAVQRFLEEARISGGLQHPGIVPVYDLGRFSDRRPFFAMKLIEGRTLAALLAERPDPAHDLPRFLKVFEQVCQTLAYAHSKGVIHRDLKPSNIMVGAFGEVQVMDWGLAKVLRRGVVSGLTEANGANPAHAEGVASLSRVGQVMGTPAYMPPEQARGEIDKLDERCDVFGLGAILCVLLTGKPLYRGERVEEVLNAAREGMRADAWTRLDGCGADAELVRLAKACVKLRAEDRPCDAGAVAEQMTAYMVGVQERLQQAEVARAQAEVKAREERKRRRLAWVLVAALLVLVSGGAAATVWYQQQQAEHELRLTRAEGEINSALSEGTKLAERAGTLIDNLPSWRATLAAGLEAVKRAEALLAQERELAEGGLARQARELRSRLEADEKDWRLLEAYDQFRLDESPWELQGRGFKGHAAYPRLEKALADYGLTVGTGEVGQAVTRIQQRPRAVQKHLRAILWECLVWVPREKLRQQKWLAGVSVEADAWLKQFVQAVGKQAWREVEKLVRKADVSRYHSALLVALAGGLPEEAGAVEVLLLRQTQKQYPGDFWVNMDLANALCRSVFSKGTEALKGTAVRQVPAEKRELVNEAIAFYRVAVGLRPDNAVPHNNLGNTLQLKGDLKGAIEHYQKAIDLDPKYSLAHNNLGTALQAQGDLKGAIASFQKAIALEPKFCLAHFNLGWALQLEGDLKGAIEHYQKGIDLDPKNSLVHNNLGTALQAQGDLWGAINHYQKALTRDPKLAQAHFNLGNALLAQGRIGPALAATQRALHLLLTGDPLYSQAVLQLQECQRRLKRAEWP